ncbi:MAG: hypothetical protein O7E52_07695 [Candidatus Poribacteria bacterium]|nr:hypothetical protein [Candidatus Poribacteria bacterium]
MKGIRKYSHRDRQRIIEEMVPLVQKKFGDNLLALAAQASYARNEDSAYSDLELIAFVRRMETDRKWGGMGKIRNGLLVELVWTTKEAYLKEVKEVTEDWYITGSDVLLPIINETFISELNAYQIEHLAEKCLNNAAQRWHEVQESTAKVLNAIVQHNREGTPLLVFDMFLQMLITLSFLNQTPYATFAQFIAQAKQFKRKPAGFNQLTDVIVKGDYDDLSELRGMVSETFSGFEKLFEALGYDLYDDNIDPNIPAKKFVD